MKSFYFVRFGFSLDNVATLLALIYVLSYRKKIAQHFSDAYYTVVLVSLVCVFTLYCIYVSILSDREFTGVVSLPSIIVNSIVFGFFIATFGHSHQEHKVLIRVIKFVLILHISAQFSQIIFINLGLQPIDYVYWATGFATMYKSFGGYLLDPYGIGYLFRPPGLSNEPSNHVGILGIFLGLRFHLEGIRLDKLTIFVIISMLLSFTGSAVIYLILIITILLFSKKVRILHKSIIAIPTIAIAAIIGYYYIYLRYVENLDNSIANRISVTQHLDNIFGRGLVSGDIVITDVTGYLYLYIIGGIASIPILLIILLKNARKGASILLINLVFISKIMPSNPLFWLYVFMISRSKK